ncbi:MAG TPA: hypothetical protein PLE24_13685 [Chitinispirillaceae bacterium]|jgi:hypothetical protein|nr:hypothetical protein [Chitinispirillaceae bacterium]
MIFRIGIIALLVVSIFRYWVRVMTVAGPNKPDNISNMIGFTTE